MGIFLMELWHIPECYEHLAAKCLGPNPVEFTRTEVWDDITRTVMGEEVASISCRIAVGPDKDKIVLALQTLPEKDDDNYGHLAQIGGFSLLVREFADSHESEKLERLCRYMYWSKPDILV